MLIFVYFFCYEAIRKIPKSDVFKESLATYPKIVPKKVNTFFIILVWLSVLLYGLCYFKNVKILPKQQPTHLQNTCQNSIIVLAQPVIFVNQYPLIYSFVNQVNAVNTDVTESIQDDLLNLSFDEAKKSEAMTSQQASVQHFQSNNANELKVITPKGTADGYSIGIDQDVLMSEVFNEFSILELVSYFLFL